MWGNLLSVPTPRLAQGELASETKDATICLRPNGATKADERQMPQAVAYTAHAPQRMLLRGISREMVDEAIHNPDEAGTGYRGRSLTYKAFGNNRIKVVCTETTAQFIVLSVMWD